MFVLQKSSCKKRNLILEMGCVILCRNHFLYRKSKEYAAYAPEIYNGIDVDGDLFDELLSKDSKHSHITQIDRLKVSPIGE